MRRNYVKKIIFYTIFSVITIFVELFNWLGFFCDELFFRDYKQIIVKSPVFIVGMPRSATTFLFKSLGKDKDRYTAMKLWEIIFAPSITQKKVIVLISRIDRMLNGWLFKSWRKYEKKILGQFEGIHPISLSNIEEDEYILIHFLACSLLVFIFPKWKYIHSLIRFDDDLPEKRKNRIMLFYKKCIQKHNYVFGRDRIYVSKSPSHTSKILSLKNTFPGCRFIYMLRIPEETISSAIGMYKVYKKIFHTNAGLSVLINQTLSFADIFYSYLIILEKMKKDIAIILKFEDLVNETDKAIKLIYKNFGLSISADFENRLKIITEESASYISTHKHSLQQHGLKVSYIRERYTQVYKLYFAES